VNAGTARVDEPEDSRLAYGVEEAARIIGIGRTLAWALVRSGDLPSVRIAGRVLIRRWQLVDWLDACPETNVILLHGEGFSGLDDREGSSRSPSRHHPASPPIHSRGSLGR